MHTLQGDIPANEPLTNRYDGEFPDGVPEYQIWPLVPPPEKRQATQPTAGARRAKTQPQATQPVRTPGINQETWIQMVGFDAVLILKQNINALDMPNELQKFVDVGTHEGQSSWANR